MNVRHGLAILSLLGLLLSYGCQEKAAELPLENTVVNVCYHPFFAAAEKGDPVAMKNILSAATRKHFETNVFTDPKAPVLSWDEFTLAYRSMHISRYVSEVIIDGDRAIIKDPVGGTLKCVKEGTTWKVDLVP